ncbi:serine O-acetyltransferase EpsC [Methanobacterium sp.]|uniref:serine O-acetyltransferase EpsC n=1 Tax=Methanobacterium sp. TaxID=2164 RepID=UPI003C70CC63
MICEQINADLSKYEQRKKSFNYIEIFFYMIIFSAFRSLVFYRISNYLYYKNRSILYKVTRLLNVLINPIEIHTTAQIGSGIYIGHPMGVVIGGNTKLGNNITIGPNVVFAIKWNDNLDYPTVGDNVLIGAGSKLLGGVKIGNNSIIGANAVVTKDVPPNSIVAGIPAKVIGKNEYNYFK